MKRTITKHLRWKGFLLNKGPTVSCAKYLPFHGKRNPLLFYSCVCKTSRNIFMLDVIFKWLHIPVHSKRNWISDQPASKMVQCRIVDVTSVEIDASVDVVEISFSTAFSVTVSSFRSVSASIRCKWPWYEKAEKMRLLKDVNLSNLHIPYFQWMAWASHNLSINKENGAYFETQM